MLLNKIFREEASIIRAMMLQNNKKPSKDTWLLIILIYYSFCEVKNIVLLVIKYRQQYQLLIENTKMAFKRVSEI